MPVTEFCELHKAEYMEILLHISVRWLSLERCVTRVLRLYDPLASYFKFVISIMHLLLIPQLSICYLTYVSCTYCQPCFIQDESQARFRRLREEAFTDPMTEVYLLFFQATIPAFTSFSLLLQRECSSIFLLHDEVQKQRIYFCCCCFYMFYCFTPVNVCVVDV